MRHGQPDAALARILRSTNPWWAGQPGPPVPPYRRWCFVRLLRLLDEGLAPGVLLRGARRVGKTTAVRQLIEALLARGVAPQRILYVPFDDLEGLSRRAHPILDVAQWLEENVLGQSFNAAARAAGPAYLFFDEVQNVADWSPQVKHLLDNQAVRALITGSSALRIEAGRDSLAGRVSTLELGPLLLREVAGLRAGFDAPAPWANGVQESLRDPDFWREARGVGERDAAVRLAAFRAFSDYGAYPFAHESTSASWDAIAPFLNETVVKRAITHDLRMGERGRRRDQGLLEEVFTLACRYAGQAPGPSAFVPELQRALGSDTGWPRILNYLKFLDGTLLVRLVPPLELRLKKRKGYAKICLCDHALRASWLQERIPLDPDGLRAQPDLHDLAGHLAESAVGQFLMSVPGLNVAHHPERGGEPEVDFVLTVGTQRIPIEVKYRGRIDFSDTLGLRAFLEKAVYQAPFGLLITLHDEVRVADPRIIPISLSSLLWMR